MRIIILAVLLMTGCATTTGAPQQPAAEEVHPRFVELNQQLKEGRITNMEYARKGLALVKELYPDYREGHALWSYSVVVNEQVERGEITKDMANYLLAERTAKFYREREEHEARLRQQYQQQQGGGITASDLLMLDMIRRPFDRMRAPTNCQSHNVAGVQYTDCY